jgi:hypothetical protein
MCQPLCFKTLDEDVAQDEDVERASKGAEMFSKPEPFTNNCFLL